ncbi:Clavaminate synthase-like protein [Xylariaceae sp. FL0016]|nr:Clavaminate synthase-like protein [Xylariaceae sp. FL0016]
MLSAIPTTSAHHFRSSEVMDLVTGIPVLAGFPSPHDPLSQPFHQVGLSQLPPGFQESVGSAWTSATFNHDNETVYILSKADLVEINLAKDYFKSLEVDGDAVSQTNFPLPTLGPKLESISHVIHSGKGFHLIRGINPKEHSVEDLTLIWLGIQSYIADQRGRQDHRGNMLVHIIADNSTEIKLGHHRHSTSSITFHNEEAGDVITWLTRGSAAAGGRCVLASIHTIYNILATHRPDIIRTLAKPDWPVALPRFQRRPLMFWHEGKLMMNFGRTPLMGSAAHPRPEHLPALNEQQREALDMVEAIAKVVQVEIQTQSGDMHFINNFTVLHRREGFVDGASAQEKRHLVRMRLRSSVHGWTLPEDLEPEWADAFEEHRCKTWHLEPMPGDAFPLRKYTN